MLRNFFLKKSSRWVFWVGIALFFKAVIPLAMIIHGLHGNLHLLGFGFIGDTPSYIDSIENLIKNGTYSPDIRMPGFGIVYLFFRLFFTYTGAYNSIVILQLVLSAVGVYYMALLARLVTKSHSVFYLCYYSYLITTFSNYFDICLMTESLCTSFLIFGSWFFARYFYSKKKKHLFLSGIFLTWVTFLKPAFMPVILIFSFW